jgi:predicted DNA-binding protein (MmcQ/YjbR family)
VSATDLHEAVRRLCLSCPESEEMRSHGMSTFRPRGGKTFAMYAINHHGDGRIALWLNVSSGVQDAHLRRDGTHFFVPPYVGPRGWLGVRLDLGIEWAAVVRLVRIAYQKVAPARLRDRVADIPEPPPPARRISVADVDLMRTPRGKRVLAAMRKVCLTLPETSEDAQFGQPVWRAGKRVFARAYAHDGRWRVAFWVGVPMQALMMRDSRFDIPSYLGHNGWIALDVSKGHREGELRTLARESYRHFALRRMLERLR